MNQRNLEHGKKPSKIRELFEIAKKRKEKYGIDNVYDFSIGNPSIPAPEIVYETLRDLIDKSSNEEVHFYTSNPGDLSVRNAIAEYLSKTYHTELKGDYIFMTCAAAAALSISFNALLEKGDEVIVFAPFFPEYSILIEHTDAKTVIVKPDSKTFLPDFDDFKNKISPKTRIVVINSPSNPTGVVYKEDTLIKISEILKEKEKEFNHPIYLIADDPYRELIYDDIDFPIVTRYYDNSLICYSFSKSVSLPGARIGYIAINPKAKDVEDIFFAICGASRALGYVCAPSLYQFMIPHILGKTSDLSIYKKNRDLLYSELKNIGYEMIYPDGAFYIFMKALEDDAEKFALNALDYNLVIVPSDSFGYKGYVRIAYCVKEEIINNSIPSFKKLYERYQK